MSSMNSKEWWNEGLADICAPFQMDISCLVDGELDEAAAGRAMVHLEECETCRAFFEDTRQCMRLHLDATDPDRLIARISTLTGVDFAREAQAIECVHRLATIFYQLGKAYLLSAIDPDFRTRVFEKAMPLDATATMGRGFVDGVLESRDGLDPDEDEPTSLGRVDWGRARSMFNGRLKQIQGPLEKGRRLLDEAIKADPSHEEARLYLAFLAAREGKSLKAAQEYRDIFQTSLNEQNRGHAAIQLGLLHDREGEHRQALVCFRWVTISGLADRDERFFFVRFNIALEYALLGRAQPSLAAFRLLLDRQPGRARDVAEMILKSKSLQNAIETLPGYGDALLTTCPELFQSPDLAGADGEDSPGSTDRADGRREPPR